jgi:gamma-glutamyltranspeptidase/glutathione hydrolase
VAVFLAAGLAACTPAQGVAPPGDEFRGAAAADEPRAVLVARDILNKDGSAADAAVALALTMTATLPSRVSLGGGGACLVRAGRPPSSNNITIGPINRPKPVATDSVVFMPVPVEPSGTLGMPGLLRGLAALHARYGKLRWEQLVAPAEGIARFGAPMSRALARDLAVGGVTLSAPDGRPAREGDNVAFPALGATLALIRQRGPMELYAGDLARLYSEGLGGAISIEALPASLEVTKGVSLGDNLAFFTPTAGGNAAVKLLAAVEKDRRLRRGDAEQRSAAIQAAVAKALPDQPPPQGDTGTTGFIVVDLRGSAVACSLTMGRLFGARRAAAPTGIVAALPVAPDSPAALSVAAALITNDNAVTLIGGAGAGGDVDAPEAMIEVLVHAVIADQPLREVALRYNAKNNVPGIGFPSLGLTAPEISAAQAEARINTIVCAGGLPNNPDTCSAQADLRGAGLSALASRAATTQR